jgi:hypothetical protein
MKRAFTLSAILVALLAYAACAQAPQGGQFSKFQEQHKYTFQLMQMVHHIGIIDNDPKYALTATQAKQVLAVIKPLRTKPKLTEDQAKQALKDLKKIFKVDQLNAMARIKPPQHRPGGGQGGPGGFSGQARPGGPGGPGGGQGNRPRFDANAMKDFNPFYSKVDKKDPRSADRAKRWNEFFSALEKKAAGKATAVKPSTKPTAKPAAKPAPKHK